MFKASRILSKCRWSAVPRRQPLVSRTSCGFSRPRARPIPASRPECLHSMTRRYKRTKKDDSDFNEVLETDDSSQLVNFRTSTMRMDTVLKHALGKSRK